jgi:hypothetical protein
MTALDLTDPVARRRHLEAAAARFGPVPPTAVPAAPADQSEPTRWFKKMAVTWGIPQSVQQQAERVVGWLQERTRDDPDWDIADVQVCWFADAAPLDWPGDAGVFEAHARTRGFVERDGGGSALWLHKRLVHDDRDRFCRTVLHELTHVQQVRAGVADGVPNAELERLTEGLLAAFYREVVY